MAEMKNSDPGAADADANAEAGEEAAGELDSESDDAPPPLEAA
jgi:hypothetical protein